MTWQFWRWPRPTVGVVWPFLGGMVVLLFLTGLYLANERGDDRVDLAQDTQQASNRQIDELREQVERLALKISELADEASAAKAQANTSVDQLVRAGETPIIAAPDVVTVPTTPVATTTTTVPTPIIVVPPPAPTTTTTEAPPTSTTTTVPETTTTTTTEVPPTTTTTTVEETTTTTAPPSEEIPND